MRIERDQIRTLVVVAALLVVFIGGLWLPHRFRRQGLETRIAAAKDSIEADRPQAQELPILAKQVSQLEQSIRGARKYVPPRSEQAAMLHEVSSDLQAQQATDQEIQTQAATSGTEYGLMPVVLNFRGSCTAVFGFIRKIEESPRLVRISKLELNGDPGSAAEPLKASVELCTFFTNSEAKAR